MEEVLTIKVRLKPDNLQAQQFSNVSETYRQACNIVSQWYFDNHFKVIRKDFNRDIYYILKNKYPDLNTAMIQSTYRTVKADSLQSPSKIELTKSNAANKVIEQEPACQSTPN